MCAHETKRGENFKEVEVSKVKCGEVKSETGKMPIRLRDRRVIGALRLSHFGGAMKVKARLEWAEAQVGSKAIGSTDDSFPEFGCDVKGRMRCGS